LALGLLYVEPPRTTPLLEQEAAVTIARIHCQVLEVPAKDQWHARSGRPRDLLPWADPYIARLIHRLEDRYDVEHFADDDLSDPFVPGEDEAADEAKWQPTPGDDWEDAFIPRSLDAPRRPWHPPVYGGFPLLDDVE
jgi:hypothetical protein